MQNTTVPFTRKNINSIPAETRIIFPPYSKLYMSCPNLTLSNTSWLIIIIFLPFDIHTHRYSFLSLWVNSWLHLVHEFGLHLSQQSFRAGKMTCDVWCWSQFWFCHCWVCLALSLLKFHWFHQNLFSINPYNSYCNNVDMAYSNHMKWWWNITICSS